jgi:uncharacterized protein
LGGEERFGWLLRDGRLRALWRVLLFALLFIAAVQLQALLFFSLSGMRTLPDNILEVLLLQSVFFLVAGLGAGWALLRWVDRRPLRELGFALERRVPRDLAMGLVIGAAALVLVVMTLALAGVFRFSSAPGTMGAWLVFVVTVLLWLALPAVAEEVIFRGYAFRALVEGIGPVGATLIMSALFAAVHGAAPNVDAFSLATIFAAGVMLSLAVLWTGSLWFASTLHLGWNWATVGLLDLPVSGWELFDAPLYDGVAVGPRWLTGGEFGPEGGLAGTLAVAAGIALTWWYARPGTRGARAWSAVENGRDRYVEDR